MTNRIVSLCTGIGGLDMAVQEVYGGEVVAVADIDPAACAVLKRHYPDIPNAGDISRTKWRPDAGVDIVTGGFPCQDISNAGLRAGINGQRSGLYIHVIRAVRELRPRLVVLENVAAILHRGGGDRCPEPCRSRV